MRVGGELLYPPKFPDDAVLNTDGYVSSFRFRNGGVSFKGRWVKTRALPEAGGRLSASSTATTATRSRTTTR